MAQMASIQMHLSGWQQVVSGQVQARRATEALGRSVNQTASQMAIARRRGFLLNQTLFTLRRGFFAVTIAATAAVGAAARLGWQFNMMKETAQVSFDVLLGSAEAGRKEVETLFQIAAQTPFEFRNVQDAARQFLGWGFSIEQTNNFLRQFSDTIAAMGGDVSIMERITLAFGQIRSTGFLMGQDLRQLTQAIPGVYQTIINQLPAAARAQAAAQGIGSLHIPADRAIQMIMEGLGTRFEGAAAKLAKTTQGRLTTMHDYASRLFGDLLLAPFEAFREQLPGISNELRRLYKILEGKGGFPAFVRELDRVIGANGRFIMSVQIVRNVIASFIEGWNHGVIPVIRAAAAVIGGVLIPILVPLSGIIRTLSKYTGILTYFFLYWITSMIWAKTVSMALYFAEKALAAIMLVLRAAIFAVRTAWILSNLVYAIAIFLITGETAALERNAIVKGINAAITWVASVAQTAFGVATLFAAQAMTALTLSLLANPFVWIAIAIIALVAALVILYFRWKWFHNLINDIFHWIRGNWHYLLAVLVGPFGAAAILIYKHFDAVKKFVTRIYDWIKGKVEAIVGWMKKIWHWAGDIFGGGGGRSNISMLNPGAAFALNPNATIPIQAAPVQIRGRRRGPDSPMLDLNSRPIEIYSKTDLLLDGKKAAEAISKHRLDKDARR